MKKLVNFAVFLKVRIMNKEIKDRETVSVVVPVYNREGIVAETLDSVKSQTYRPIHLIAVDNNSTDNSLEVLMKWKVKNEDEDFTVSVLSELKPGAAAARNRGLKEVASDKLVFFDSDDIMYPDMIETGIKVFEENREVEFVYWRHERECIEGGVRKSHFTTGDKMECHLVHALLNTPSYMVKTEYMREIGGWNEETLVWDDYELGVRMLFGNARSVGIDRILYRVKSREQSITGTDFSSRAGKWEEALDKIEGEIEDSGNSMAERWKRIVDYRRIILAAHYAKEGREDLAHKLRTSVKENGRHNVSRRMLLDFAYHYTRRGGRGAWLLLSHFF